MFWLVYAVTCAVLHHILSSHYQAACSPSWWSFLDASPYCAVVHKALHVLSAGPLLAALPALSNVPRLALPVS